MKKVLLVVFLLSSVFAYSQKPTDEMFKSIIACGGIATEVTLAELESYLVKNGNAVDYEIFNNNEIILIAKKVDNLLKKTNIVKIQFNFIKGEKISVLLVKNALANDEIVALKELYFTLLEPLNSKLLEQKKSNITDNRKEQNKLLEGEYKGLFINADDEDEKEDLQINIIFINNTSSEESSFGDPNSPSELSAQVIYKNLVYSSKLTIVDGMINIFILDNYFEFMANGKIIDNVYAGTGYIKQYKKSFFSEKQVKTQGTFKLKKIK